MLKCCEAVRHMDGVGPSCVGLAENTRDPATCESITRTISYMLEDRETTLPEECK